jgi:DNA-binding NarL/FixJ family response regulator
LVALIDREADLIVCGEAASADEAMQVVERTMPELVILDLSLQGKPGLEVIKDLSARFPEVLVLVLSMHDEVLWAERVLRAGACGYVMKQESPRNLVAIIRRALAGETCVSEKIASNLLRKIGSARTARTNPEDGLGDRELEVLQLISQGLSTREIAAALHISVRTVDAHREHIKHKLNLSSGDELLRYAVLRFLEK